MMRWLYTIGVRIYALLIRLSSIRHPKAKHWIDGRQESFKRLKHFCKQNPQTPKVWFHAASLGEFEQGRPLIERFRERYPQYQIVLTFFSPSGYQVRKHYPGADLICYLPNDTPSKARLWVGTLKPEMVFFIKYEYWYNYLDTLRRFGIATYFVSAIFRSKQLFFKPWGHWFSKHLKGVDHFFVQNEHSLNLLKQIGITQCTIVGDTRFDRVAHLAEHRQIIPELEYFKRDKPLLIAGSTWPADERLISQIITHWSGEMNFVIVPHEIHRDQIAKLQAQIPQSSILLSQIKEALHDSIHVLIVDRMGLLSSIYAYGQYAYIGGGFGQGIHNILEAACYGLPILFGPKYEKFQEAHDLIALQAAVSISSRHDLDQQLESWQRSPEIYEQASQAAQTYVTQKIGASDAILNAVFSR